MVFWRLEGGMISNLTNRFRSDSDPTQGVEAQVGGRNKLHFDMNNYR